MTIFAVHREMCFRDISPEGKVSSTCFVYGCVCVLNFLFLCESDVILPA